MQVFVGIISFFALIVAVISLRTTIKFRKDDNYTKRTFLAPGPEIGILNYHLDDSDPILEIILINSGINPLNNLSCMLYLINSEFQIINKVDGLNSINPIPNNEKYFVRIKDITEAFKKIIVSTKYIKLKIEYYDILLKTKFNNIFYWEIFKNYKDGNGELTECSFEDWQKLKNI